MRISQNNCAWVVQSMVRRKEEMKRIIWMLVLVACIIGFCGCREKSPSVQRTLPHGPTFDAVYERLGDPDRMAGSGRSFLYCDLKNGQTLMLIVSGNTIIGSELVERE
jgi:hypothetical protein